MVYCVTLGGVVECGLPGDLITFRCQGQCPPIMMHLLAHPADSLPSPPSHQAGARTPYQQKLSPRGAEEPARPRRASLPDACVSKQRPSTARIGLQPVPPTDIRRPPSARGHYEAMAAVMQARGSADLVELGRNWASIEGHAVKSKVMRPSLTLREPVRETRPLFATSSRGSWVAPFVGNWRIPSM